MLKHDPAVCGRDAPEARDVPAAVFVHTDVTENSYRRVVTNGHGGDLSATASVPALFDAVGPDTRVTDRYAPGELRVLSWRQVLRQGRTRG